MNFVLLMVTTAPLTRSTSGATDVPDVSAPDVPAGGGGAERPHTGTAATMKATVRLAWRVRLATIDDDAPGGVIWRQRDRDLVPQDDPDTMLAKLAPQMGEDLMAVLELDAKVSGGKDLDDPTLKFDMLFSTHRRADLTRSGVLGQ
jgi:hypothetical protein